MFFVLDILVNFRTAVLDDGELVQRPAAVAVRYLRGWFALDLVATIPYDRVVVRSTQAHTAAKWSGASALHARGCLC